VLRFPGGAPGEIRFVGGLLIGLPLLQLLFCSGAAVPARARVNQLERQLVAAGVAEALILLGVRLPACASIRGGPNPPACLTQLRG
jgi:hypothetical protein